MARIYATVTASYGVANRKPGAVSNWCAVNKFRISALSSHLPCFILKGPPLFPPHFFMPLTRWMFEINPEVFRKVPPGEPALWFYSRRLSLSLSLQTVCGAVFVIRCFLLHLPQGVTCILPVLREGVLTGSPEQKEEAAKALGAVIKLTSPEALRPSVVSITGPLIRILGDRFAWTVKTALLETLTLLLAKVCTQPLPVLHQP